MIHEPTTILGKSKTETGIVHGCITFIPDINPRPTSTSWKSVFEIDQKMEKPPEVPIQVQVIFLLDLSLTMVENNAVEDARTAVITCLDGLKPDNMFNILVFGEK